MPTIRDVLTYTPVELSFGTSGLRGLVTDMTDLECYINTAGFLRYLEHAESLKPASSVYIAGDLRASTPRILRAVHKAVIDCGYKTVYCGTVPTPAVALHARVKRAPCIMVTGSHIPADRNGIKFYKIAGEVLKPDEPAIKQAVGQMRADIYVQPAEAFTPEGALTRPPAMPREDEEARQRYMRRFVDVFDARTLAGKKVVCYEHSSVGRDMLTQLLRDLGAEVVSVGRSEVFVPIDNENITPDDQAYFKALAAQHPDAFAIVSTDGDSDRPFVVDETGVFHRGDVLGAIVAEWLKADFAAYTISSSDAVDTYLHSKSIETKHTKIGSPYVLAALTAASQHKYLRAVGWEVNGGLLQQSDLLINGKTLSALPTRDAFLPIIGALRVAAVAKMKVSELFAALPQRFTQAGLIDNFSPEVYQDILARYATDTPETRHELGEFFPGFGKITKMNTLDGLRLYFASGDIAHIRLSSNAPQLRMYSVAGTQARADEIVAQAIKDPGGIFRQIEQQIAHV